jgi:hypothetical protein
MPLRATNAMEALSRARQCAEARFIADELTRE